jgi:hypothetical protein
LLNEEKLKTITQQNWIVLTRKAQFQNGLNNATKLIISSIAEIIKLMHAFLGKWGGRSLVSY